MIPKKSTPYDDLPLHELRKRAAADDSKAMLFLGVKYLEGDQKHRVRCIPKRATKLFKKAAALHEQGAQHNLGMCYAQGLGIRKSWARSKHYLTKAATPMRNSCVTYTSEGLPMAHAALGEILYWGRGTPPDHPQAIYHWYVAAKYGNQDAISNLYEFAYDHLVAKNSHHHKVHVLMALELLEEVAPEHANRLYTATRSPLTPRRYHHTGHARAVYIS